MRNLASFWQRYKQKKLQKYNIPAAFIIWFFVNDCNGRKQL